MTPKPNTAAKAIRGIFAGRSLPRLENRIHSIGPETRNYNAYFTYGYVVSSDLVKVPAHGTWTPLTVGRFSGHAEANTNVGRAKADELDEVVFFGYPIDIFADLIDANEIARQVAVRLKAGDPSQAIEYASELGGRFTCLIAIGAELIVVPDCHAAQPVFLYSEKGTASLASHASLLAEAHSLQVDNELESLIAARKTLNRFGTIHAPGLKVSYPGVKPLISNCTARLTKSGDLTHHRFYPTQQIDTAPSFNDAYNEFEELFVAHTKLLARLGVVGISLTAGVDSQSTFAVARDLARDKIFTFTYMRQNHKRDQPDVVGANDTAFRAGVLHKIASCDRDPDDRRFFDMFSVTWPEGGPPKVTSRALFEDLPGDFVEFMSTGAETGSAFWPHRNRDIFDPAEMSRIYIGVPDPANQFHAIFADYSEWADFEEDNLHNIDPFDLFYWEHRMSRWAGPKNQTTDLGHLVVHPYNHRGIVESMLKASLEARQEKRLQKRLISRFGRSGDTRL